MSAVEPARLIGHDRREAGPGIVIADVTPGRTGPVSTVDDADFFIPTERPYIDELFFLPDNRDFYFARTLPRARRGARTQ